MPTTGTWARQGVAAAAAALCCGASAAPEGGVFDVPADGKLILSVDGRAVETFSSPGMPSELSLKRTVALDLFGAAAEAQGDKARGGFKLLSFSRNPDTHIGPVVIKGYFRNAAVSAGAFTGKTRMKWSQTDRYDYADALAGPYALPAPIVRYRLRVSTGGEAVSTLPLLPAGALWVAATDAEIGGKRIRFAFAPQFETSIASAAAGAAIHRELGGALHGAEARVVLSHGIDRPVRTMRLDRPLALGPIRIGNMLVRVADYGSTGAIGEGAADPAESPDDIVVTGKRKRSAPAYIVYVGADALQGCTSITYDKPARRIHLECR